MAVCVVKKEGAFNIPAKVLYDKTWDQIADWAQQYGYTVVDHDEYLKNGNKRFTWLENVQAQGWRVQKRNSLTVNGETTYSGVLARKL